MPQAKLPVPLSTFRDFDFADALHLAASEGTEVLYTFDERFIRKGKEAVPPVLGVPEG